MVEGLALLRYRGSPPSRPHRIAPGRKAADAEETCPDSWISCRCRGSKQHIPAPCTLSSRPASFSTVSPGLRPVEPAPAIRERVRPSSACTAGSHFRRVTTESGDARAGTSASGASAGWVRQRSHRVATTATWRAATSDGKPDVPLPGGRRKFVMGRNLRRQGLQDPNGLHADLSYTAPIESAYSRVTTAPPTRNGVRKTPSRARPITSFIWTRVRCHQSR